MSATRNDRLGRNPFDKRSYAASPKPAASPSAKRARKKPSSPRRKSRAEAESSPWRLIFNELVKLAPPEVRKLKICARVRQAQEQAQEAWQQLKAVVST